MNDRVLRRLKINSDSKMSKRKPMKRRLQKSRPSILNLSSGHGLKLGFQIRALRLSDIFSHLTFCLKILSLVKCTGRNLCEVNCNMFFKLGFPLRDFIHFFDMAGRRRNRHTTYNLEPHPDSSKFWDHSFDRPTLGIG